MLGRDLQFHPWRKYDASIHCINERLYPNQCVMGFFNLNDSNQKKFEYIEVLACTSSNTISELRLKIGFKNHFSMNEFLFQNTPIKFKKLIYSDTLDEDEARYNLIFHPNNRNCLDEFLQTLNNFDSVDIRIINHISAYAKNFKEALNGTQKNIIEGFIKFPLDDIIETLLTEPDLSIKALNATLQEHLTDKDLNIYKEKNVLSSILQIREIFSHPCPQNRTENYPYFGIPSDNNIIVYKDRDGKPAFEQKGLLSLTARNNDTNSHVTKAAVVGYIYQAIHERIKKFRIDNMVLIPEPHRFFNNNRIMIANIDVGYGHALFISGEHQKLGRWTQAHRMNCHENQNSWIVRFDKSLIDTPFKFLIGPYSAGANPDVSHLIWEEGENRKVGLLFELWSKQSTLWPSIFKINCLVTRGI